MSRTDRTALWQRLVAVADVGLDQTATARSGDVGYLAKSNLCSKQALTIAGAADGDGADLVALTQRFSPADVALARDGEWRALPEFATGEPVAEMAAGEQGRLSDPYVLDGKLCLGIVDARRTGPPDARMLARMELSGFDAWFASEKEAVNSKISRSPHPLPELEPSLLPSPSAAVPSVPNIQPSVQGLPGQPVATPVKTDELGLPMLP